MPPRSGTDRVEDFMRRPMSIINNLMVRFGMGIWDYYFRRLQFTWAGHFARMVDLGTLSQRRSVNRLEYPDAIDKWLDKVYNRKYES